MPTDKKKSAATESGNTGRDKARMQRIQEERGAHDPGYRPTDKDAQIDASGARFKSDG